MPDKENISSTSFHNLKHGSKRAYNAINQERASEHNPGIVFLAGHGSDMEGGKAIALENMADRQNIPFLRFDYFGHGRSDGRFLDGNLSRWLEDCTAMLDALTEGPQILVGSSLGGWLMVLTALKRKSRIAGLVGIAAAPDFTEKLIWDALTPTQQEQMKIEGQIAVPNPYADEDVIYPYHLIKDGQKHLLLKNQIDLDIPVILHQGMKDNEVPWETAIQLAEKFTTTDLQIILDKHAGHRYSEASQIDALVTSIMGMHQKISSSLDNNH